MTVTASTLIAAKYASTADSNEYTVPANTTIIIDKFTATNISGVSATISVNLIPSGVSISNSNLVTKAQSIGAGVAQDLSELKNHILNAGDKISVVAGSSSAIVIRASGRVVT